MALDENSTLDDAKAAYKANASFEEDASVTKAKAFVTACRFLLLLLPQSAAQGGESVAMFISGVQEELKRARQWLAINDPATTTVNRGGVIHPDFTNLRN